MRLTLIAMVVVMVGLVAGARAGDLPAGTTLAPPSPVDVSEPPVVYPPGMYLATSNLNPGAVLFGSGNPKTETIVFRRPSGLLTAFCIWGPPPHNNRGYLYFANGFNGKGTWSATGPNTERPLWEMPEYVRDIIYDPGHSGYGVLLSYAFGATRDGEIRFPTTELPPAYMVRRAAVGGTWGGNFALDSHNKLYVSTGASMGAKIWQCPDYGVTGGTAAPSVYYSASGPILGFCFASDNVFYYTDGTSTVRKVTINRPAVKLLPGLGATLGLPKPKPEVTTEVAFVSPHGYKYTDVVVVK